MKFAAVSWTLCSLTAVEAATHVAVLEFGRGGSVRRTDAPASSEFTSAEGVASFWNALHRGRRLQQRAGMPVVPDLFRKPDAGVVLSLSGSGVDLDHLPVLSGLLESSSGGAAGDSPSSPSAVGRLQVEGQQSHKLLSHADRVEAVEAAPSSIRNACHQAAGAERSRGFSGIQATLDATSAQEVDREMSALVQDLQDLAESTGKTVVLHLLVEEEEGSARRRHRRNLPASSSSSHTSRRLEEERDGEQQNNQQQQQNQNNQQQGEGEGNNNGGQQQYNGYYGYGYYNAYEEWVTPYKTMFQIQYFNVVLWTSLGLVFSLLFVVYLMIYMPLEPDTLLFGESAKMVGSE